LPVSNKRRAVSSFSFGVLAIPLGPIHIAIAGTPNFIIRGAKE
jgi:hypothetical protein